MAWTVGNLPHGMLKKSREKDELHEPMPKIKDNKWQLSSNTL